MPVFPHRPGLCLCKPGPGERKRRISEELGQRKKDNRHPEYTCTVTIQPEDLNCGGGGSSSFTPASQIRWSHVCEVTIRKLCQWEQGGFICLTWQRWTSSNLLPRITALANGHYPATVRGLGRHVDSRTEREMGGGEAGRGREREGELYRGGTLLNLELDRAENQTFVFHFNILRSLSNSESPVKTSLS